MTAEKVCSLPVVVVDLGGVIWRAEGVASVVIWTGCTLVAFFAIEAWAAWSGQP